jgi:hypothetical protein
LYISCGSKMTKLVRRTKGNYGLQSFLSAESGCKFPKWRTWYFQGRLL